MGGMRRIVNSLETDVLVVGGGGAGMFAAISAARNGAQVVLAEKNVVGRGAHQRDDFPRTLEAYQLSQRISLKDGELVSSFAEDRG